MQRAAAALLKLSSLGCVGKAAELFGLDGPDGGRAALVELLTVKEDQSDAREESHVDQTFGRRGTISSRCCFASALRGIFAWQVDISNQHLMVTEADASAATRPYIGVLDIFGFESFP